MKKASLSLFLAAFSLHTGVLPAQQPTPRPTPAAQDPFAPADKRAAQQVAPEQEKQGPENPNQPRQILLRFETFSLAPEEAAKLLREGLEGKALYDRVLQKLDTKEAIQEGLSVVIARSGEKALIESITEIIYPTEYQPGYAPTAQKTEAQAGGQNPARRQPQSQEGQRADDIDLPGAAPACPTSFETRNTGFTFEVEPTLSADNKIIDLRAAPNYTVKAGDSSLGQGLSRTEMPVFETQRFDTALTLTANTPFFTGTYNRTPNSTIDPATANRVWFAFITPTIINAECHALR